VKIVLPVLMPYDQEKLIVVVSLSVFMSLCMSVCLSAGLHVYCIQDEI